MSYLKKILLLLFSIAFLTTTVDAAQKITIAVLSDGENAQTIINNDFQTEEIRKLLEPQYQVQFVELNGGWSETQINQVLQSALADPEIDLIFTSGLVGTHIAGKLDKLAKPVIGSFVPDPILQGIPVTPDKTSGKNNYTYMSSLQSFSEDMAEVFAILPGDKFALISDQLIADGVPTLASRAFYEGQDIELMTATDSVEEAIAKLPDDLDAILVAPLLRFTADDITTFANELIKRKIASVSFAGSSEIEQGLLLSVGSQPSETLRLARRIALNIMSVLDGENAANLPVQIQWGESIQYNSDTARAIGFELPWELALLSNEFRSADSETIRQEKLNGLSLNDAVNIALERNLSLEVERLNLDIAGDDLHLAKASWWPQLTLNAQITQLDEDITSAANPEGSVDANLGLTQLIYSESAKSGLDIARLNQKASKYVLDATALDTISTVSTAYLNVLRAQALEDVQRSNLKASVQNLELSEDRFRLGAVTETDVLRWKNQIATDKQNLLSAQTDVKNAIVNLQTLLHQPIALNLVFNDADTKRLIKQTLNPEVRKIFDTPDLRNAMTAWTQDRAIYNAPEIKRNTLLNAISERQTLAAKRAFYVPSISLSGQQNNNLDRYGASSDTANAALPDNNWNVGVVASYPIFQGRKRQADYAKAKRQEKQTFLQTQLIEDSIKANAWSAWNRIGSSYPAIYLSKESADAAQRNLELIRDQYSSGSISIATLIDAQTAALSAQLAAAQAEYTYLIDMVAIMRATSDFRFLTDPGRAENWLKEFYEFKLQQEFKNGVE